jgi:hypothetical protein
MKDRKREISNIIQIFKKHLKLMELTNVLDMSNFESKTKNINAELMELKTNTIFNLAWKFNVWAREQFTNKFQNYFYLRIRGFKHNNKHFKNAANLENDFTQFYLFRIAKLSNIHILFWLGLVDFEFIFDNFLVFLNRFKFGEYKKILPLLEKDFDFVNQSKFNVEFDDPDYEMLEFINQEMYKFSFYNYAPRKIKNINKIKSSILRNKVIKRVQKLVFEKPYDESLLKHVNRMKKAFSNKDPFDFEEVISIFNKENWRGMLNQLSLCDRWELVNFFTKNIKDIYSTKISDLIQTLDLYTEEMRRQDNERISNLMTKLDIVAMTTTGACKYREQLRKVKSKIIVVEEAAEVLEAQIVSCLSKETEQLILIGDHLQLQPKVNSFTLSEEYGLSVSLFERLVSMGVPNVRLNQQRRMRPEIGDIVRLIYPGLKDHPSVSNFGDIRYGGLSIFGED